MLAADIISQSCLPLVRRGSSSSAESQNVPKSGRSVSWLLRRGLLEFLGEMAPYHTIVDVSTSASYDRLTHRRLYASKAQFCKHCCQRNGRSQAMCTPLPMPSLPVLWRLIRKHLMKLDLMPLLNTHVICSKCRNTSTCAIPLPHTSPNPISSLLLALPLLRAHLRRPTECSLSLPPLLLVHLVHPRLLLRVSLLLLRPLPRRLRLPLLLDNRQPRQVRPRLVRLALRVQFLVAFFGLLRLQGFALAARELAQGGGLRGLGGSRSVGGDGSGGCLGARLRGVVRVCGCVVGVLLFFLRRRRQVVGRCCFLTFALDRGVFLGFCRCAAFFSCQLGLVGAVVG